MALGIIQQAFSTLKLAPKRLLYHLKHTRCRLNVAIFTYCRQHAEDCTARVFIKDNQPIQRIFHSVWRTNIPLLENLDVQMVWLVPAHLKRA